MMSIKNYTEKILEELKGNASYLEENELQMIVEELLHAGHIFTAGAGRSRLAVQAFTNRLGGVVGELFRYENPQTMVVAWAQGAFGTHEQTYRLMELAGRSYAAPTAAQQLAGEQLAESLPVWPAEGSVSLQDGYLLVCLGEA